MHYRTVGSLTNMNKTNKITLIAIVGIMVIVIALISKFYASQAAQQQEVRLQERSNMLNQIDQKKGAGGPETLTGTQLIN